MPHANFDVIRRLYRAFNQRDYETAASYAHEEVECYPALTPVEQIGASRERLRGRAELREFFESLGDAWQMITVELDEMIETPDGRVLAAEVWHVRGRDGIEMDTRLIDVYALRDGLVIRTDGFRDRAEALTAVGLEE